MDSVIRQCSANIGLIPREWRWWDRWTYLRVPKPLWLRLDPSDHMTTYFRHAEKTLGEGVVVWGHVVQANRYLFESTHFNCPGEVVYCLDTLMRPHPDYLSEVANRLYSLKGTHQTDPDLAYISNYLANERIRVFGVPVPPSISPSFQCRISTTLFVRKHLPKRRLCSSLLPLLVSQTEPHVAIPLPARYWPSAFRDWWVE